eukprot:1310381-Rhodomonas_salina.4
MGFVATPWLSERLADLNVPFLVIHGGEDKVTSPEYSQRLYDTAQVQDKKIVIYEGTAAPRGQNLVLSGRTDLSTVLVLAFSTPPLSFFRVPLPSSSSSLPPVLFPPYFLRLRSALFLGAEHADLLHGGPAVKALVTRVWADVGGWLKERS